LQGYVVIADQVAAAIADGTLRPGDRLPPQRIFAHQHGIAASTASRVYAELARRGLTAGEVGRGTFVRAAIARSGLALTEPVFGRIDLEMSSPVLPHQHALLAPALLALARRPDILNSALQPCGVAADPSGRLAAARSLQRGGWQPDPATLLFAGSGRQALAAVFSALVPQGGRIGFEELTYPVAKAVATRLGFTAVRLAMDEHGLRPDAVAAAHRSGALHAIYVQPTLHNPLGITMPDRRRAELAAAVAGLEGSVLVEDAVYGFLQPHDLPPLAARLPEQTVLVDSLSKRVAPGLTLGFIAAPAAFGPALSAALRSGGWAPTGLPLDLGLRWLADGTVAALEAAKRDDAAARQAMVTSLLGGLAVQANPAAYHAWLHLPDVWRADTFVLAAARRDIAITPASAFSVMPAHAPNAVRIALASPTLPALQAALTTLAALARNGPEAATLD